MATITGEQKRFSKGNKSSSTRTTRTRRTSSSSASSKGMGSGATSIALWTATDEWRGAAAPRQTRKPTTKIPNQFRLSVDDEDVSSVQLYDQTRSAPTRWQRFIGWLRGN